VDLPPLRIVLTAAGCPGAATLIGALRANGERRLHIHGVDMRADAVGRFLCDGFDTVPPGDGDDYVEALADVVARERPDVLLVQSSNEVGAVARERERFAALGAKALVASPQAVAACNDKAAMYTALLDTQVPQPRTLFPSHLDEFVAGCAELGYPAAPVCFKPAVAKGSRGFHVVSAASRDDGGLLCASGGEQVLTLEAASRELARLPVFPRLLLMEYVDEPEHVVDALVADGDLVLYQTKTREAVKAGLAMRFRTVHRPDLVASARHACSTLRLDWFASLQFKGDKLIEVNPRLSTFVIQEDFCIPYLGIKYALGELDDAGADHAQARLRTTRRSVRYYDQVFWDE
jgi:carbamoyl-phosphate synthase large subunit